MLFNAKAILLEEPGQCYLTHRWEDKGALTFPNGICPKVNVRGSLNKFPDFFRMGTFIDSTHETLVPFEVISSCCNALVVPFQQLLKGPMEVLLCVRANDLRHSLFQLLNCLNDSL